MTITARYASRCATCQGQVLPGAQIEWSKGAPVRHATCPTDATPATTEARPSLYTPRHVSHMGRQICRGCGGPTSAPGAYCGEC